MRVILNKMKGYSLLEGYSLRDTWPFVCSRNTQGCVEDSKLAPMVGWSILCELLSFVFELIHNAPKLTEPPKRLIL